MALKHVPDPNVPPAITADDHLDVQPWMTRQAIAAPKSLDPPLRRAVNRYIDAQPGSAEVRQQLRRGTQKAAPRIIKTPLTMPRPTRYAPVQA